MYIAVVVIHVVACFAVILVVLLQKGKGADLGAAFGGSSQPVFGSQGAGGFLTKLVAACVGIFMLTSLGLAYISSSRVQSTIMQETESAAMGEPGATVQEIPPDVPTPAAEEGTTESSEMPEQ